MTRNWVTFLLPVLITMLVHGDSSDRPLLRLVYQLEAGQGGVDDRVEVIHEVEEDHHQRKRRQQPHEQSHSNDLRDPAPRLRDLLADVNSCGRELASASHVRHRTQPYPRQYRQTRIGSW